MMLRKIQEYLLNKEADRIIEEVNKDPDLQGVKAPDDLYEKVFERICEIEDVKSRMSDEQKELIRLGTIYRKKQKRKKYWIVATAAVLALAMGITSFGDKEKVFYRFTSMFAGRDRDTVDSEEIVSNKDYGDEQVYEEIEKQLGFFPVKIIYKPKGTLLQEYYIFDDMPAAQLIYSRENNVIMSYWIRPNYLDSSWGKDVEDILLEEKEIFLEKSIAIVNKYLVKDNEIRWLIQFEYKNVYYSIYVMNVEYDEVEKIIKELHFS